MSESFRLQIDSRSHVHSRLSCRLNRQFDKQGPVPVSPETNSKECSKAGAGRASCSQSFPLSSSASYSSPISRFSSKHFRCGFYDFWLVRSNSYHHTRIPSKIIEALELSYLLPVTVPIYIRVVNTRSRLVNALITRCQSDL